MGDSEWLMSQQQDMPCCSRLTWRGSSHWRSQVLLKGQSVICTKVSWSSSSVGIGVLSIKASSDFLILQDDDLFILFDAFLELFD
jgi:hypothetical protein